MITFASSQDFPLPSVKSPVKVGLAGPVNVLTILISTHLLFLVIHKMELVLENDVEGSPYLEKVKQVPLVIPKVSDEQIAVAVGGTGCTPRSCRNLICRS
jgi:hypothetical protein